MPPRYVTEARRFNLAIPHLRSFVELGASASGVIRVTSTVTYPSHTTVVTDVLPAARGIVTNTTFDPLNTNREGWYWYTEDTRVPTLWSAAAAAKRNRDPAREQVYTVACGQLRCTRTRRGVRKVQRREADQQATAADEQAASRERGMISSAPANAGRAGPVDKCRSDTDWSRPHRSARRWDAACGSATPPLP